MKHRNHIPIARPPAKHAMKQRGVKPVIATVLAMACIALLVLWLNPVPKNGQTGAGGIRPRASADSQWQVGTLRSDGLRIVVSGHDDASAVLDPHRFTRPEVRHGYWIATQIPALLNKLYCWCGCENRGVHRSNLQCFEDTMATECPVCLGTAEIAYDMSQEGIADAAKIQAAVDVRWRPR